MIAAERSAAVVSAAEATVSLPVLLVAVLVGVALGAVGLLVVKTFERHRAERQAIAQAVDDLRVRVPTWHTGLLSPHHAQAVPFLGRKDTLDTLLDWCTADDPDSGPFRLITGPGGVGKTRLAVELQRRLQTLDTGWVCVLLAAKHDPKADVAVNVATILRQHARDRPVLIVVDYAENRPGLRELLTAAHTDRGTIRVLMLARTAGNWWDTLTGIPGDLGAALRAGYDEADLPDLDADPQDILDAATTAYAQASGIATPSVQPTNAAPRTRVLDLVTAALVTVLTSSHDPARPAAGQSMDVEHVAPSDVFDELLRHEAAYWRMTARGVADGLTVAMQRALVAVVALVGAQDKPSTVALARRVLGTFTEDVQPDPVAAAYWLRKTYTPAETSQWWVEPLTPDRVAEHLVVKVLTQGPHANRLLDALLEGLTTTQAIHAMSVLSRAATDPARNDAQQEAARTLADHLATHLPDSPQVHAAVLAAIPSPSARMAPTAALLTPESTPLAQTQDGANRSPDGPGR